MRLKKLFSNQELDEAYILFNKSGKLWFLGISFSIPFYEVYIDISNFDRWKIEFFKKYPKVLLKIEQEGDYFISKIIPLSQSKPFGIHGFKSFDEALNFGNILHHYITDEMYNGVTYEECVEYIYQTKRISSIKEKIKFRFSNIEYNIGQPTV